MTCNLYVWMNLKLNIIRAPDSLGCRKVEKGYL